LIIFNIPSVLGALSLFTDRPKDIDYNKRGKQMYLVGYTKAVFMLFVLIYFSYKIEDYQRANINDEEKVQYFERLKVLCQINLLCDLVYSILGVFVLRLTQAIIRYLGEREDMNISFSALGDFTTSRLTNTKIEMRSFRE